jgi:hypothetical protein
VKTQAKNAAAHKAQDAMDEVRMHPGKTAGIAAAVVGAISLFAAIRSRQRRHAQHQRALAAYEALPAPKRIAREVKALVSETLKHRAEAAKPVIKKARPMVKTLRESGVEALHALRSANYKKAWTDQVVAPLVASVVIFFAIGAGIFSAKRASRRELAG